VLKKNDVIIIVWLVLFGAFIWLRDLSWTTQAEDTLSIIVALPLFVWMGRPWKFLPEFSPPSKTAITITALFFVLGIALNYTILLVAGWITLLWSWLSHRLVPGSKDSVKKLLILPFMAFPWIFLDADRLGWWFRLSAAWTTARFFSLTGFNVVQEGTNLLINGLPISVEAACAGLNTLQSMLIAGSLINFIILGKTQRYWWNLPVIVALAWLANTVRIIFICLIALVFGPRQAMGSFHLWGGAFILFLMFGLCWLIFSMQEPRSSKDSP
jgi:exosortase/archaeosortase family protein